MHVVCRGRRLAFAETPAGSSLVAEVGIGGDPARNASTVCRVDAPITVEIRFSRVGCASPLGRRAKHDGAVEDDELAVRKEFKVVQV